MSPSAVKMLGRLGKTGALILAIALNLAIFSLAPLLIHTAGLEKGPKEDLLTAFLPVRPTPPPMEEEKPPPPKKEPPKMKLKKLKMAPMRTPQIRLETPQLDLEINPKLTTGVAIPALGPSRFEMGDVDRAPMITARIPPPYPYLARRRGLQGAVTIRFLVDLKGKVQHLEIVNAKPTGVFEDSVLKTVSRWRFKPGMKEGEPVETWVETTIRFKLER
jgi:protein TonB